MITVESTNGHIKPVGDREIIWAGTNGAFFCVMYGPFKYFAAHGAPDLELKPAKQYEYEHGKVLTVYHEAEFGREVFRVEQPACDFPSLLGQEPKTLLEQIKDFFQNFLKAD